MDAGRLRLERLFARGGPVIVDCCAAPGGGDPAGVPPAAINPLVDGVLLEPGLVGTAGTLFARRGAPLVVGCLVRNGGGEGPAVAFTVGQAQRRGVEIAFVPLVTADGPSTAAVGLLRRVVAGGRRFGLPVVAEYLPGPLAAADPARLQREASAACRALAGLGADVVVSVLTRRFFEVVAACPVPLLARVPARLPSQLSVLKLVSDACRAGARGVVCGRDVVPAADPVAFQAALCAVAREGLTGATAMARHGLRETPAPPAGLITR